MAKTVLYVDDDEKWRQLVSKSFAAAGHDVIIAKDASEGMSKADGADLGLIILDLDLSGESGLALMKFLKWNHPGVPVLLLGDQEQDDNTVRAMLKEGADQYIAKNSIEELLVTAGMYFR
jgi:DNA-binding response OmpR family regulator